ncbi:MAG: DUF1553 domain-containing protein [Planctomycetaceae bacterium]|nr:MAG: DUF1553 domain-containing protein [Planctomycetaceae bacterium]
MFFMSTRLVLILAWLLTAESLVRADSPNFNRDIRPILSDRCFACHGPDEATREADLRLDQAASATEERDGYHAVSPGDSGGSEVIRRVISADDDLRMPPPEFGEPLTVAEIELLRQWIDAGGEYAQHWSLAPLHRPSIPTPAATELVANPVDAFILRRLEAERLLPGPPADPRTLLRRLAYDLTGLPPDGDMVDAFVADPSPDAYRTLVAALLNSPHHGERMATYWLDLVRYADTLGYHGDQEQSVWPYRDYVIDAFNQNKPFDQFTIEQLAGDLLPDPTLAQRVASTYNRLNRSSGEGGVQPKEYLAKYSADRVRTTGAVWLGSTFGCAECHDHKFDDYTAKDFYSFAAFFADIKEEGIIRNAVHIEQLPVPTPAQQRRMSELDAEIAVAQAEFDERSDVKLKAFEQWKRRVAESQGNWKLVRPVTATSEGGATLSIGHDGSVLASGDNPAEDAYLITATLPIERIAAVRLELLPDDSLPAKGPGRAGNGNLVLQSLELEVAGRTVEWTTASATHTQAQHSPEFVITGNRVGWAILPQTGQPHQFVLVAKEAAKFESDDRTAMIRLGQRFGSGHNVGKFRIYVAAEVADEPESAIALPELLTIFETDESQRTDEQRERLWDAFRQQSELHAATRDRLRSLQDERTTLQRSVPTTLATTATTPREIRVLPRGDWMNDSGELVEPALPHFLPAGSLAERVASGERLNRLDLARWMVDRENPVVARTMVNRLWMLFFGNGISRSVDDLGSQGEVPSHPELIDWLAAEFIESGWDVRHIIRLLVGSATYQRSSTPTAAQTEADPFNRLLARQSRWRYDAEPVRDNALAVSGLLERKVGGRSARPYQPPGYWRQLNFPMREYEADTGSNQYRRGLYTHWQRTFLHPSLLAFDAPPREECTARRDRSNTPVQALVLLNDPSYVEAATALAARVLRASDDDFENRLETLFRMALARKPRPTETQVLGDLYQRDLAEFREDGARAAALVSVGQGESDDALDDAEWAAWTGVCRAVLNLHESIMRY